MDQLNASINNLLTLARSIALVICAGMFLVGGFQWMTAQGNPSASEKAKSTLWSACIGFGVIMASSVIANALGQVLRF